MMDYVNAVMRLKVSNNSLYVYISDVYVHIMNICSHIYNTPIMVVSIWWQYLRAHEHGESRLVACETIMYILESYTLHIHQLTYITTYIRPRGFYLTGGGEVGNSQ